jgi:hypothetical protein
MLAAEVAQLNQVVQVAQGVQAVAEQEQVIRVPVAMQLLPGVAEVQVHLVLQVDRDSEGLLSSHILKAVQCI